MAFVESVSDFIWNPWLLGLFLITGLYYSVRTGFFQLFGVRTWLGNTLGQLLKPGQGNSTGITRFQALATALASTIGTGSISGVATAIWFGGPGAVFWMWISAFLGMMVGWAEKILTIKYRKRNPDGTFTGGPMYYLRDGLYSHFLAGWFAVACVGGALAGGDLVQSNSIAQALNMMFGWNKLAVGIATAALAGVVLSGGIGRIARFSELLVPVMALLFLGSGALVLWVRRMYLPGALKLIITSALMPRAAVGGMGGYTLATALRYGVARGVFTNEAGVGSSALVHAKADVKHPGEQGLWGIVEVFVATVLICTVTALVILSAGIYDPARALNDPTGWIEPGVPLAAASFAVVMGKAGECVVAVCLVLFAFSSLLGWSYYGQTALEWLVKGKKIRFVWQAAFLLMAVIGSVGEVGFVWQTVDLFTALMALPNLGALLVLSPQILACGWEYLSDKKCV
ncbi:MAG: sodium:alanine symporter family protein [Ruminococcaceae bacterium]|nr:sodium:alanine symporter family protein [Oscillospiraceae bacterium]